MSDQNTTDISDVTCESYPTFRRNNYFYGKLLTVNDFRMEQQYFINKQRLANRLIHGVGVVCGLQVGPDPIPPATSIITISPGLALDHCGREIIVASPYTYDLGKNLPSTATSPAKIYIQYDFCGLDPATNVLKSSNCKDNCCYSTVQEGFKIVLQPPSLILGPLQIEDICAEWNDYRSDTSKDNFCKSTCSPSNEGVVLLAEVYFTRTDGTITINQINNSRNRVFGNGTLYSLLECLKNEIEKDLPKIQTMNWTNGQVYPSLGAWQNKLFEEGFLVTFDRQMNVNTINEDTVSATLECYSSDRKKNPFIEKKDLVIRPEIGQVGLLPGRKTTLRIVLDRRIFGEMEYGYFGNDVLKSFSKLRFVIRIKGDFVLGTNGKCLDGDFLGGKLPSGDGSEGGLFESWVIFKVPVATSMTVSADPATVMSGQAFSIKAAITPSPPTSADAFHNVKLTLVDPSGHSTTQTTTYKSDGNGNVIIQNLGLPLVGTYKLNLDYPGEVFASSNVSYQPCSGSGSVIVKELTNTSIKVKIPDYVPVMGADIPVSATVSPKPASQNAIYRGVTLHLTEPDGKSTFTKTADSGTNGVANFTLTSADVKAVGNYSVQAKWGGDTTRKGCTSAAVSLAVAYPGPY